MNYLSRQDILDLHSYIIERYGGRMGIASQDKLISAVDAPRQTMFGDDLYPDLPSKASALAFLLIKNRPFRSANEATALLAILRLIEINGVRLKNFEGLIKKLGAVSRSALKREELEEWLRSHITG
ncbi:MAG: death-on-curing protein [Herpetosiphonaceae bacterium]|nr:MAG: death-on-curing protein [Herpetosiphonaceae bacterium]